MPAVLGLQVKEGLRSPGSRFVVLGHAEEKCWVWAGGRHPHVIEPYGGRGCATAGLQGEAVMRLQRPRQGRERCQLR